MIRMHEEIADLAGRFDVLVSSLREDQVSDSELRELRRVLYGFEAVLTVHLAAEEDMLSQVQDLVVGMSAG